MISRQEKTLWADYIRVLAVFEIVWLHSVAPLLYQYNSLPLSHWWIGNVYDSIVRTGVPAFFMLSGYLLLGRSEPIGVYVKKRAIKVAVPMAVWTVFFIFWKSCYEGRSELSPGAFVITTIRPAYYHLWFLYALLGVYVFMPFLRTIVRNCSNRLLVYFLAVWFVAVAAIPLFERAVGMEGRLDLAMISGHVGYFVMGYLIGNLKIRRWMVISSVFVILVCLMVTAVGTYYVTTMNGGKLDKLFYNYLSPNVILMSASTFLIARQLFDRVKVFKSKVALKIVSSLSAASFGMYLVHTVFLYILKEGDWGFVLSVFWGNPAYSGPLTAAATIVLSYLVVVILQKIPFLRRCVPS